MKNVICARLNNFFWYLNLLWSQFTSVPVSTGLCKSSVVSGLTEEGRNLQDLAKVLLIIAQ